MSMWNTIIKTCRLLVGSLFIVSGLIKANDALGFVYKLEEYFEPGALNLPGLTDWALPLAVFICVGEILLGVAMVIGALPKITAMLTGIIMAFFTWLTWYTANCDPFGTKMIADAMGTLVEIENQCVLACGCFGNAIPLTPYESFIKDLVLSVLTVPILVGAFTNRIALNDKRTGMIMISASLILIYLFGDYMLEWNFPVLFAAITYAVAEGLKTRINSNFKEWIMAAGVTAVCVAFQMHTLNHLPLKDYRAYAVGESVVENRKSAEQLGLQGPVFATEYTFRNVNTGADTLVLSSDWLKVYDEPWFNSTYETVSFDGREVKVSDGYEPRILDFQIIDSLGEDRADEFLNYQGNVLLFVSKDLENANTSKQGDMNELSKMAAEAGWMSMGLTNAPWDENRTFQEVHGVTYDMFTCDQTELKIVIRSNPGIVWLNNGVVQHKWAWRDVPAWEELKGGN